MSDKWDLNDGDADYGKRTWTDPSVPGYDSPIDPLAETRSQSSPAEQDKAFREDRCST